MVHFENTPSTSRAVVCPVWLLGLAFLAVSDVAGGLDRVVCVSYRVLGREMAVAMF